MDGAMEAHMGPNTVSVFFVFSSLTLHMASETGWSMESRRMV